MTHPCITNYLASHLFGSVTDLHAGLRRAERAPELREGQLEGGGTLDRELVLVDLKQRFGMHGKHQARAASSLYAEDVHAQPKRWGIQGRVRKAVASSLWSGCTMCHLNSLHARWARLRLHHIFGRERVPSLTWPSSA